MSRSKKAPQQVPKLRENEAFVAQDTATGDYRLLRDNFGTQNAAAKTTTNGIPTGYIQPTTDALHSEIPYQTLTSWKWARWGNNDRYPHETIEKLQAVPIAGRVINDMIKMAYGEGIGYEKINAGESEVETFIPKIETFLRQNKPHKILPKAYGGFYRHNCVFAVFTLNGNNEISNIEIPDTAHCRLAVQDETTYKVETLLYSKKFGSQYTPSDEDIIAIPILEEWDKMGFFANLKTSKFAMFLHGESPAMLYYPEQAWKGLLKDDGWLSVSADVPRLISAINKNQVVILMKIGVDDRRFVNMYGDGWRKDNFMYEGKNKKQLRDAYWDEIEKAVNSPDNAGKTIKYIFTSDHLTGRVMDDIKIEPIDIKIQQGAYIPTSQASDQQIVQALGADSALIGLQASNSALGGNSGSNKMVGFNQAVSMNTLDQDIVLEIYNFVAEFNKWGVCFEHKHMNLTTQNNKETGIEPPQ